jgi:drug/metabolite transporter (DMT)-like permease
MVGITNIEWQKRKREKMMGYLIRFGAVVIWGILPIYIKYTEANSVDPLLRVFFAGAGGIFPSLILLGIGILFFHQAKKIQWTLPLNKWLFFIILGKFLFLYFTNFSLMYTSGTNMVLLESFAPVFALIIAIVLWREKIPYLKQRKNIPLITGAFLLGSIGSSLLFYNDIKEGTALHIYGDILAILLMFADTFLVVSQIQYAKYLKNNQSAILNLFVYIGIITITTFIVLFSSQNIFSVSVSQFFLAVGIGFLSGLGQILNYEAFRRIDGFLAYLMFNMAILITFAVEAFFLETIYPTLFLLLGGSMIIGASIVAEKINSKCEKQGL